MVPDTVEEVEIEFTDSGDHRRRVRVRPGDGDGQYIEEVWLDDDWHQIGFDDAHDIDISVTNASSTDRGP